MIRSWADKIRWFETTPLGMIWSAIGDGCHLLMVGVLALLARGNPAVQDAVPLDWMLWGLQWLALTGAGLVGLFAVILTLLGSVVVLLCWAPRDLLRATDDPRSVFAKPPSPAENARS